MSSLQGLHFIKEGGGAFGAAIVIREAPSYVLRLFLTL